MVHPFIELSSRVAETIFKLQDRTPYKELRYTTAFEPKEKVLWMRYYITIMAESPAGSTLWYQCSYIPESKKIISSCESMKPLTIDEVVAQIEKSLDHKKNKVNFINNPHI